MRTIVMLSDKRCGSTAVHNIFRKHPDAKICHVNQNVKFCDEYLWEPGFWLHGANAINGDSKTFIDKFSKACPFLKFPKNITEEVLFDLWDKILMKLGGVVFDKTPHYLGHRDSIDLLAKYRALGNDVRVFAFIRDGRDAICSMYKLWGNGDFKKITTKEGGWLKKYRCLEDIMSSSILGDIPLYKYEEFAADPSYYAKELLKYCGLKDYPKAYDHIKQVHVGRHRSEEATAHQRPP